MSLAQIYNFPSREDPRSIEEWAFANADSHLRIIQAIARQKNITLIKYILYPLSPFEQTSFALRHQQAHNQFDQTLGLPSSDYTNINYDNQSAYEQILYLHAEDHRRAEGMLGI